MCSELCIEITSIIRITQHLAHDSQRQSLVCLLRNTEISAEAFQNEPSLPIKCTTDVGDQYFTVSNSLVK